MLLIFLWVVSHPRMSSVSVRSLCALVFFLRNFFWPSPSQLPLASFPHQNSRVSRVVSCSAGCMKENVSWTQDSLREDLGRRRSKKLWVGSEVGDIHRSQIATIDTRHVLIERLCPLFLCSVEPPSIVDFVSRVTFFDSKRRTLCG